MNGYGEGKRLDFNRCEHMIEKIGAYLGFFLFELKCVAAVAFTKTGSRDIVLFPTTLFILLHKFMHSMRKDCYLWNSHPFTNAISAVPSVSKSYNARYIPGEWCVEEQHSDTLIAKK